LLSLTYSKRNQNTKVTTISYASYGLLATDRLLAVNSRRIKTRADFDEALLTRTKPNEVIAIVERRVVDGGVRPSVIAEMVREPSRTPQATVTLQRQNNLSFVGDGLAIEVGHREASRLVYLLLHKVHPFLKKKFLGASHAHQQAVGRRRPPRHLDPGLP